MASGESAIGKTEKSERKNRFRTKSSFTSQPTGSPGKLGKQSRLAGTLAKLRGKGVVK